MARKTGRNFDGCWTCRARKVKCDLTRPNCLRCIKSKKRCGGYNIVLGWSNPLTITQDQSMGSLDMEEDLDNFQRRNVDFVKFPQSMVYETYRELNENLDKLDSIAGTNQHMVTIGPFSTFRVDVNMMETDTKQDEISRSTSVVTIDTSSSPSIRPLPQPPQLPQPPPRPRPVVRTASSTSTNHESIFSKTNNSWVHYELMDYAKLTIIAIKGVHYKLTEQNILHILYPKFFPNIDSDDWFANAKLVNNKLYKIDDNKSLVLFPLFKLLSEQFTSDIFTFNRVLLQYNYFDILVIPLIKQILGEFVCFEFTSWDLNRLNNRSVSIDPTPDELLESIKIIIVDLVFGLSAFKYSKKQQQSQQQQEQHEDELHIDEFLRISIELRKLSITIINYHLDEYDNNSELIEQATLGSNPKYEQYDILLLLALILQIELDSYFSVYENYELIFAIGDYIAKNKLKNSTNNLTKFLVHVFKVFHVFFESTQSVNSFNYEISKDDEQTNYRDLNENYDLIDKAEEEEEPNEDNDSDSDDNTKKLQIKPSIQNLIISNDEPYAPMAFTISFNKRNDSIDQGQQKRPSLPIIKPPLIPSTTHGFSLTSLDINSIYLMYGLPKSLIELFHEIIHLTNHKNFFTKRKVFPRNFPKICAEVEDKLVNWKDSNWELDENNPLHKCLQLNILSFHQSLMVYYNRLIKNNSQVQQYIDQTLSYLQQIIEIPKSGFNFKPTFWTLLVCGAEVSDKSTQEKIKLIWGKLDNNASCNYWRAKQILYEIWKRRDIGEDVGFMDMIREWDIVLCLG
ncbi:Arginine metabolism regulation protein II [Spathaspora sp. JA1]|nr:Arginine metabolism regulation protein II [Spathaspora sp. JA1]